MKNEFIKKNFALILAFLLPILLIVIVAIVTYFPFQLISTKYNFIYSTCLSGNNYYSYNCNDYLLKRYSVVNDKLIINDFANKENSRDTSNYTDRIFLHDTSKNESREISLKEAQTLTLNDLLTAPDGVTVSSSYDRRANGVFPFIFDNGYSSYGYYLTKGKSKSKINLINNGDQYYYQNNFKFIGWILPARD